MPKPIINRSGYSIKNEAEETVYNLFIYDEISAWWGVNKVQILQDLKAIKPTAINLHISSLGGDVDQAIAIRNLIKGQGVPVNAYLTAFVASSATIIMTAADNIYATFDTLILAHCSMTGGGNKHQQRKNIETLEMVDNIISTYYAEKAESNGKEFDKDYFLAIMDEDTWKTAEYWQDLGIVDEIIEKLEVAASAETPKFNNEYFNKFNLKMPIMPKNGKKKKGFKNAVLQTAVSNRATSKSIEDSVVIEELAQEAGIEATEVQAYLDGSVETPDNDVLEVFATHLGVDNFEEPGTPPAGEDPDGDGDGGEGVSNALQTAITNALTAAFQNATPATPGNAGGGEDPEPQPQVSNEAIQAASAGISNAFAGILASKDKQINNLTTTVNDLSKKVTDLVGAGSGGRNGGEDLNDGGLVDNYEGSNDAALKNAVNEHLGQ